MGTQSRKSSSRWQTCKALFAVLVLVLGLLPSAPLMAEDSLSSDGLELHGTISQLPTTTDLVGDWMVGGKVIHVSKTTVIQQKDGKAAVGAYVEIKGTPLSDGSLNAAKIEVQLSPGAGEGIEAEFIGTIDELPSTTGRLGDWKVSGRVVHVLATTRIQQERLLVAAGAKVKVEGLQQSDGSVNAIEIEMLANNGNAGDAAKFVGRIEELPSTANRLGDWKISGRVVHVTTNTTIKQNDGAVALGVLVKVEGIALADGSLNASQIETKSSTVKETGEVQFRGTVESLPNAASLLGEWRVSGRTVHVTGKTKITTEYGATKIGSLVEVNGVQQADQSVAATRVEVESQPSAPVRNTPGYNRFFGVINSLPATASWLGEWSVGNQKLKVVTATTLVQEKGPIALGALVEVVAVAQVGTLEAVRIEVKAVTGNSTGYTRFTGKITALPAAENFVGTWTVGGKTVHVTTSTRLTQKNGKIVVNAFVKVEGNQRTDGSVDATSIEVKTDSTANGTTTGFTELFGTIASLPNTTGFLGVWTVTGKTINVTNATTIDTRRGAIAVGKLVEVKGHLKTDGSIDATHIEVKGVIGGGAGATFIEFVGTIKALPTTQNFVGDWTVESRTVRVSAATFINREHMTLAVGLLVEVKGALQSDGSVDATSIEVKRASNFATMNRLTSVNAGGYQAESSAAAIIASFGSNLAATTQSAASVPLPTSLAGVAVLVDGKPAPLFFVSPTQINYQVPENTARGTAKVEVVRSNQVVAQGALSLSGPAPSLFTANADGTGVPSGYVTRVKANNEQVNESFLRFDQAQQKFVATPILRQAGESLYLVLWGTGFHSTPDSDGNGANGAAENVEVTIGGLPSQVVYAGRSGYVGVEQLNIHIPANVTPGTNLTVLVRVNDGQGNIIRANEVLIAIQ